MKMWPVKEYDPTITIASTGKRLTTGLFHELSREDAESKSSFSIQEWGKVYVSIADPTGYTQAMHLLGDWEHWEMLKKNPILKPIMERWDKEVEIKLRSEAIKNMITHSRSDKGQTSAKWLAEAGFRIGEQKVDGRRKVSKVNEENIKEEVSKKVKEDMERLGLAVVAGGH